MRILNSVQGIAETLLAYGRGLEERAAVGHAEASPTSRWARASIPLRRRRTEPTASGVRTTRDKRRASPRFALGHAAKAVAPRPSRASRAPHLKRGFGAVCAAPRGRWPRARRDLGGSTRPPGTGGWPGMPVRRRCRRYSIAPSRSSSACIHRRSSLGRDRVRRAMSWTGWPSREGEARPGASPTPPRCATALRGPGSPRKGTP